MSATRRGTLAAVTTLAAGALPAAAAPIGSNDAQLLTLAETMRAALADYAAICCAPRLDGDTEPDHDALDQAWARWEAAAMEAASIPADGLPGLAVKAARAVYAISEGPAGAERVLAESLADDIARLCPEASA